MTWTYNNIGDGPVSLTSSGGYAIANSGVIAGQGIVTGSTAQVFVGISSDWTVIPPSSGTAIGSATPVISDTGLIVGGYQNSDAIGGFPWSWTAAGGLVLLDSYGSGFGRSLNCVNSDGTIFGGGWPLGSPTANAEFVTWEGGASHSHGQTASGIQTVAYCCNAAGTIWGGGRDTYENNSQAWTWTQAAGFVLIPFPAGQSSTYCVGISTDGSLLLVWAWNSGSGISQLYTYDGSSYSELLAPADVSQMNFTAGLLRMSDDGSVILGVGINTAQTAYINWVWNTFDGTIDLLPLPDGVLGLAKGMSRDGQKIIGGGNGGGSSWIIKWTQDSPPPTPPTAGIPVLPRSLGVYRGQVGINFYGKTLFGDAVEGLIGEASFDTFSEYGAQMQGLVSSPPIHSNRRRVFISRFELDIESGVGDADGTYVDPVWMLQWSKDGGRTWSEEQPWRTMGRIGEYTKRLRWMKLGQSRQWIFRLVSTDPVRRVIIGVYADRKEGMG